MVAHQRGERNGIRSSPKEQAEMADQRQLQRLQQHLSAEGYVDHLGFESVPLVSRLLEDLLSMRDTNTTLASHLTQKTENEQRLQSQIQPVQKELSRMVKENNQLHLELIQKGEELELFERKGALQLKKLDSEIKDRVFVLSQQSQHIKDLEHQLDIQKERIQELLDPNFTCTAGPGGNVKPKGQEISISRPPAPPSLDDFPTAQPLHVFDEDAAARQIADLLQSLSQSKATTEELSFEVSTLQTAVTNREQEIARMGKLLMRNVNSEGEDLEKELAESKETVKRLNGQLDFLSKQLAETEELKLMSQRDSKQIQELIGREAELKSKLADAEQEVRDLCSVLKKSTDDPPQHTAALTADSLENLLLATRQQLMDTQTKMDSDGAQLIAAQSQNKELQAEVESLQQRLKMAEKVSQKAFENGEDLIDATRAELTSCRAELEQSLEQCRKLESELAEVRRLRDSLYAVVWDFENQMAEIQTKIGKMAGERDEKGRQAAILEQELAEAKEALANYESGATTHTTIQLDQLQDLQEQVRVYQEEVQRMQQSGEVPGGGRDDEELRALVEKVQAAEQQLKDKNRALEELQTLMSHMDETRAEVVTQLKIYKDENTSLTQRGGLLETQVKRLQDEVRRYEGDVERAKGAVSTLDGERDSMLGLLEEKSEMVRILEERVTELSKQHQQARSDTAASQQQSDMLRQALEDRESKIAALQRNASHLTEEKKQAELLSVAKTEEARVLSSDLSIMTRENQVINDELADLVSQRDGLKRDLAEAVERLTVSQQLVKGRDKEREDILCSYRALNEEKSRAESAYERLVAECQEVRAHVYAREEELQRAKETLALYEQEHHRVNLDMQALQRHVEGLSEKLVEEQRSLKACRAEGNALKQELQSSKNVAALLEKQKQDGLRESALLRDEIVALRAKLGHGGQEKDVLLSRLEGERGKVRELEDVLQALRAKEHAAAETASQRTGETMGLQDQLHKANAKVEKLQYEVRALRSQSDELQYEVQRHRRAGASESSEKESLTKEMSHLRASVQELQHVVEQQNSALETKNEEQAQMRTRLTKMQAEAEKNEKYVLDLEAKLRIHDDTVKSLELSARQTSQSVDQHVYDKEELRTALRRTEQQLEKVQTQYKATRESEAELQGKVASMTSELRDVGSDRGELGARLDESRLEAARLRKEVISLSGLLEKLDGDHRSLQRKYLALHESSKQHVEHHVGVSAEHSASHEQTSAGAAEST